MFRPRTRTAPWPRLAATGAVAALLLAACGSSSSGSGGGAAAPAPAATTGGSSAAPAPADTSAAEPAEKVTLKVNFWGDFGLKDLVPAYEKLHPNITIKLNAGDYAQQHQDLQKYLVAGSGAPDISAIDEGYIVSFRNQADKFVNLLDLGAGDYESKYLGWKWKESLSSDGKSQIGLGTDVGGQAMCYRSDLFKAAGLPSDRDAVSKLWPTWDDFIATGKKYVAATGGGKKEFVDAATNVYIPVLGQQKVGYFDEQDQLQMDGGPKVAWDIANKMIAAKISANLASFAPEWNAAMKNGAFAVLACPAWMMGYIQGQAPGTTGKWDIADIPGGGGNWGGSFWTIPKQGKHQKEAYDFITWLVAPEQQIAIFKKVGNLPSQPALYDDPAIQDFKNPFFSNAPVGVIFSNTAKALDPQYQGKKAGAVSTAVQNVLTKVQQGKESADAGWAEAVKEATKAAK